MTEDGRKTAVTVGFFDGVHRGHQFLVSQLCGVAASRGLEPVAVTFDRHPRQLLHSDWQPQLLSLTAEKEELLLAAGVRRVVVLPFTAEQAALSARDFMQQVLVRRLRAALLLTGYDNHFGHRTADSHEGYEQYVGYGRELGIDVVCGQPLLVDGQAVSSSRVRRQLSEGRVEEAAACLGRRYQLCGTVEHGHQRGRLMGFPTANLRLDSSQRLVPAAGVYATVATVGGNSLPAVTNIGMRPTFDGHHQTVETHILDYAGDLYGQPLRISFVARLRGEQHFGSADELARQMTADAEEARRMIK